MTIQPIQQFANGMILSVLGAAWLYGKLGNVITGIPLRPTWLGWLVLLWGLYQMFQFFKFMYSLRKSANISKT